MGHQGINEKGKCAVSGSPLDETIEHLKLKPNNLQSLTK